MSPFRTAPLVALVAAAGCDQPKPPPAAVPTAVTAPADDHDDHDHGPGPHGGTVFDLGRYHAEFTVDHTAQTATVFVRSGNLKRPLAVAADKLTLTLTQPAVTVELLAAPQPGDPPGKASQFAGRHPALGAEQGFAGSVAMTADGKEHRGRFAEHPLK